MASESIDGGGAGFRLSLKDDLTKDLQSTLENAVAAVRSTVSAIDREVRSIGEGIQDVGKKMAGLGLAAGAAGVAASVGFVRATIAAGDFAETSSMFDEVFKDQSASVREWGDTYAKTVGRSREQMMRFLAESQDTFVPLGFDRSEAAELSKTITKLAVDLGSFKNIDDGEALRRLIGGVIGNTENLRAFGVVAQEAQIKAKAFELGFDPKNLTAYQKALAILELTIEGTKDAQGDAERTSGSFANSVKKLKAAFSDLQVEIGEPLREVAATFIQGIAAVVQGLADMLKQFPIVSQVAAGLSLALTAIGTATAGVSTAIVALGSVIAQAGLALFAFNKIGISVGGILGKLVAAVGNLRAAFAGMIIRSTLAVAFKALVAGIVLGISLIAKAAVAAGATIAKALVNPWTLLVAAIYAAAEAAKYYYSKQEEQAKIRGEQLEQERQRIVAQSFRDAGQPVPEDLGKTFDPNNARVVSPDVTTGALSNAAMGLAEEIRGLRSPVERFRERMSDAGDLLKRGTITQEQFQKFAAAELADFRSAIPEIREKESLISQLMTPLERFKAAITQAQKFFKDQPDLMRRAMEEARKNFQASDPAEQMKMQLLTPAERLRMAIADARKLFADQPEFLRRAIAAAVEEFKRSEPKPVDDPDVRAAGDIRDSLKTEAQRIAEQMAEATRLALEGKITKEEAQQFNRQLRQDFLGEDPRRPDFQQMATQSAAVASNISAFAPSFDNTASEEKAYRRRSLELQDAAARELKKIRRRRPAFI